MSLLLRSEHWNELISIDAVYTAFETKREGGGVLVFAKLKNGDKARLSGNLESLRIKSLPVVSAEPGWFQLVFIREGEVDGDKWESHVDHEPIVAWRIDGLTALPVVADDHEHISNPTAVMSPDGKVRDPGEGSWDSVDGWLKRLIEEGSAAQVSPAVGSRSAAAPQGSEPKLP